MEMRRCKSEYVFGVSLYERAECYNSVIQTEMGRKNFTKSFEKILDEIVCGIYNIDTV